MTADIKKLQTDNDGTLPSYAWPGGYPIFYMTADNAIICPDCANGKNGSECQNPDYQDDKSWRLVASEVHWEGQALTCEHCNAQIESAYGGPDDESKDHSDDETE